MQELVNNLKTRYEAVLQSTIDKDFYMCLYHYFDYIHKTPQIKEIFDKSEAEYTKSFREIWKEHREYTEQELDEKSSQVHKLEKFNLYAVGCTILVRIYWPIDDYQNTTEPDNGQDPVAIILVYGADYALKLNRWSKETIKRYSRWFDGKRNYYEAHLRRFHIMLLDELSKPKKMTISFDKENSLLKLCDKEVRLTLKNDKTNAHYVLEYVFSNEGGLKEKSFYTDVIDDKFSKEDLDWRSIYRACNDINKKVSEQASISNFLIIKSGKSGYTQVNPNYL